METDYLKGFLQIAKRGTYSEAARDLFISQSTLSKHILALEKEFGVLLFDRTTRTVKLTQVGKRMIPIAEKIVENCETISDMILEEKGQSKSELVIFSIPVTAQYGITEILSDFSKLNPDITLKIREHEGDEIPGLLADRKCDLAFQRISDEDGAIEKIHFFTDRLVAVLPKDHRLSDCQEINLAELANESFILLDERTKLYPLCLDACEKSGFSPNIAYLGHHCENILKLVSSGMGVSLLMKKQVSYEERSDFAVLDVSPPIFSTIYLTRRKSERCVSASNRFWKFIENESRQT